MRIKQFLAHKNIAEILQQGRNLPLKYLAVTFLLLLGFIYATPEIAAQVGQSEFSDADENRAVTIGKLTSIGLSVRNGFIDETESYIGKKIVDLTNTETFEINNNKIISFLLSSSIPIPIVHEDYKFIVFYKPLIGVALVSKWDIKEKKLNVVASRVVPIEKILKEEKFDADPLWTKSKDIPQDIKTRVSAMMGLISADSPQTISIFEDIIDDKANGEDISLSFFRIAKSMLSSLNAKNKCAYKLPQSGASVSDLSNFSKSNDLFFNENKNYILLRVAGRSFDVNEYLLYSTREEPLMFVFAVSDTSKNCRIVQLNGVYVFGN